jgi:integrase
VSVFTKKGSPFYHYDFRLNGQRFTGSTKVKSKREAEAFERLEKKRAAREQEARGAKQVSLLLADVRDRYWDNKGQHHSGSRNTRRLNDQLVDYFDDVGILAITDIDDAAVRALVAWRRNHKNRLGDFISPYTVNDTTEALSQLFVFVKGEKARLPQEPKWEEHFLKEPVERVRELVGDEESRIDDAARDDYAPILTFAKLLGLRQKELILRWPEVNWDGREIVKLGKGGRRIRVRITDDIRALLWPLRGHHDEFVFTFEAKRNINKTVKGRAYVCEKGKRYPITQSGLSTAWRRTRMAAGIEDFRFHDFRHDFGTKALRKHGNPKTVQRMMNHASLESTLRYAHVTDQDVADAWDSFHEDRAASGQTPMQNGDMKSRKKSHNRGLKQVK